LLQELQPGSLIIMDNASFHKTQKTREILEESGHELIFLPPYSPDFNPLKNTLQTSKKSGLVSHRTLPLTTLFDCTVLNGFYYSLISLCVTSVSKIIFFCQTHSNLKPLDK
ncbi:MAG: transposase, partial [SAR324 cluster bacterium]|nr:transposase [SAR324 cluster bacterium]